MVKLKINNKEVAVEQGSTILAAAKKAGIFIPTLCHDERLTPYGACRLCMVAERKRPAKIIPSCFTPARDGMDIVTENPEILKNIKTQLQLILINHPLDCSVCDKAGECALQNLVIRYGITSAPYKLVLRPKRVDRESLLIERDMNRCILCGRCVRICAELQGRHEIDFTNRGIKTSIGTDGGRPLACDFCGQCVSACPVGALTDNTFKNKTRVWKLKKQKTICSQCGMGCSLTLNTRDGEIMRVTAPLSEQGVIGNLCARGRFGWKVYTKEVRATLPQIMIAGEKKSVGWSEALSYSAEKLNYIRNKYGTDSIAVLSADCLTTEETLSYRTFLRGELGVECIGSTVAGGYREIMKELITAYGNSCKTGTPEDLLESDIVLVLGGGAAELHPVLKTVISKFLTKEGRELVVISSWPDFCWEKATMPILVNPEYYEKFFREFCQALEGKSAESPCDIAKFGLPTATFAKLISLIHSRKEITLIAVPGLFDGSAALASLSSTLYKTVKSVIPLGAAVNSRGFVSQAALTSVKADAENLPLNTGELLEKIENNKIKALYLLGDDPLEYLANSKEVKKTLSKLELLIHQSPYLTASAELAHVVLPSAVLPEKTGSVIDMWGKEHIINAVLTPPAEVKTDAEILAMLESLWKKEAVTGAPKNESAEEIPVLENTRRRARAQLTDVQYDKKLFPFVMIAISCIYGDSIISRQSPEMRKLKGGLKFIMNTDDAENSGITDKSGVFVDTPYGKASGMAEHSLLVRRGNVLLENVPGNEAGLNLLSSYSSIVQANIYSLGGDD